MAPLTRLDITVTPKSSRTRAVIGESNAIRIFLTAPPVDGRANEELIVFLSRILRIPKSRIEIVSGLKGRKKQVAIEGITASEAIRILKGGT